MQGTKVWYMAGRGREETDVLRRNVEEQLDRLVQQLADLDDNRDEFDEEDYRETREETLDQLRDFSDSLSRMKEGNLSLVDDLSSMQLAIQAAISEAFRTPEVIRLFARRQPGQLRQRLAEVSRDEKVGKVSADAATQQKLEILAALQRLEDALLPDELAFLQANADNRMQAFAKAPDHIGSEKVLKVAGSQVDKAST